MIESKYIRQIRWKIKEFKAAEAWHTFAALVRRTYRKLRMKRRDRRIFYQFVHAVRQQFPEARIWAFGSRVDGTAREGSDLDVCVVLPTLDRSIDQHIMDTAWEVGFEHELVISTVTYSTESFEHGPCSQSSLVHTILTQGVPA